MATIADVTLSGTAYVNLNSTTAITTGTNLVIQNKGSNSVRIIISPTQPDSASKNGWLLGATKSILVENESEIVWARGVLNVATVMTASLSGMIPANKFVRLRTVNNTGTPTFTYRSAQEVLL